MLAKLLQKNTIIGQLVLLGLLLTGLLVQHDLANTFLLRPLNWSVFFCCLLISWVITNSSFIFRGSLIPHLCMVLWYFLFASIANDLQLVTACLFMQIALFHLLTPYGISGITDTIFEASIFTSFATLVYFPAGIFGGFILIFLVFFRNLNLKSIFLTITGLMIPVLILGQLFYLTEHFEDFTNTFRVPKIDLIEINKVSVLCLVFLLISIFGVIDYYRKFFNQINKNKRAIFLAMMFGLVGLVFCGLYMGNNVDFFLFLCLPLCVFTGRFIEIKKSKNMQNIWLLIVVGLAVAITVQRYYYT